LNASNSGSIVLNETGLKRDEYKLTLNGVWNVGQHKWDVDKDAKVKFGAVSFSSVSAVPEPESYAMFLAGLGLVGTIALRRRKTEAS
jgi:hypothetical protein